MCRIIADISGTVIRPAMAVRGEGWHKRANDLPFSRREHPTEMCQKANDFAREAVSWDGGVAGAL